MYGSWNLPIFLLRDGSLTLINIASLMVLAIFWSSLPTMLKLPRDTSWPVMLWWSRMGCGALMCSLNLSPKSCLTLQCTIHCSPPFHTCTCRSLHSSVVCYPYTWGYQEVFDGTASFEINFYPMFFADVFAVFTHALYVWYYYVGLFGTCVTVLLIPFLFFFLFCVMLALFNAHIRYLHLPNTLLR